MKLHYREYGSRESSAQPVVLIHGLFGSGINWHRVATVLAEQYWVIVPDLRNHGRSPHHPDVSYPAMAEDVRQLLHGLQINSAAVVGHSMGGKLAMWLALQSAELVQQLIVADIAPVTYPDRFTGLIQGLRELPLDELESRQYASQRLSALIPQPGVRDYLLQNLLKDEQGWHWRLNLSALQQGIDLIMGFPEVSADVQFSGSVSFIHGEQSDYLLPEYEPVIRSMFPNAEILPIANAGHWVYAEQPEAFLDLLQSTIR